VETERILVDRLFALEDVTCLVVSHRRDALAGRSHHVMNDGPDRGRKANWELACLQMSDEMQRLWHGDPRRWPARRV